MLGEGQRFSRGGGEILEETTGFNREWRNFSWGLSCTGAEFSRGKGGIFSKGFFWEDRCVIFFQRGGVGLILFGAGLGG